MSNKDNKQTYNAYMNEYMKKRYFRRKNAAINRLGGKCVVCETTQNLELDHINPEEKEFTLAQASSFSESRWEAELSKCQLLCSACHKQKHSSKALCGTMQRYWRGCKCDLCKKACRDYNAQLRSTRKETS